MKQSSAVRSYISDQLNALFDAHESANVSRILTEFVLDSEETSESMDLADQCIRRIKAGEPVQYITGTAWFYDLRLKVNRDVLIPRPETEELVHWVLEDQKRDAIDDVKILDMGTGSGCIALAIKHRQASARLMAIDVSERAIQVAAANAQSHGLAVTFMRHDILLRAVHDQFDVIVSNPPYITPQEFDRLTSSVRDFEPREALIAKGDDGLIFYKRLAEIGQSSLRKHGSLYVELNEFHADEIDQIFRKAGYATEMRKDLQGKWRMLRAVKNEE